MIVLITAQAALVVAWIASIRGRIPADAQMAAPGLLVGVTGLLYRTSPVWPTMMMLLEQAAIATALLWLVSLTPWLRQHWLGRTARALMAMGWAGFFLAAGMVSLRNETPLPPLMAVQAMLIAVALAVAAQQRADIRQE